MAETDSTRPSVPGARSQDEPGSPAGAAGASAAGSAAGSSAGVSRDDGSVPGIAQRHDLPRRKAGTLPDLSRIGTDDPEEPADRADDGAYPAGDDVRPMDDGGLSSPVGDGDRSGGAPTRMLPVTGGATAAGATSAGSTASGAPASEATAHGTAEDPEAEASAGGKDQHGVTDDPARDEHPHGAPADEANEGRTGEVTVSPVAALPTSGSHAGSSRVDEPSTDTAALSVRPPDKDVARRAAVRDQAVAAKPVLPRFLQVVVALFFPVIVVAAAVRAVATSSFLWLEYHRPGFPADRFGFSLDDRMTYGSYALDYVLNFAPPRYLGGLVTPEGEPLFLESEVGHMADVKGVLGLSFFIALVLFVLSVLACVYLARRYKGGIRRALFAGAVLTLVGIVALTVLAVLAWQTFFTQVHALFFADGTWTFRADDTLIRLFPEQFWTDSAITVAVLVLAATVLTLILTWPTRARRERSMLAQDAAQARYREALDAS